MYEDCPSCKEIIWIVNDNQQTNDRKVSADECDIMNESSKSLKGENGMIFELKNCNSINLGQIEVVENALNIFYAINGTGKSTIAKALATLGDQKKLEELRPFKYKESTEDDHRPCVAGMNNIHSINIFDERYVSQYIFKTDEVIQNSFEIFIKTPDYERQLQIIDDLIKETKNTFTQNPELDELISDFTTFVNGFGKAQGGYSAAGALGKGLGKGNKVYNIPEALIPFKDYIQNSENGTNSKWLKWHLSGNEFIDIAHQCPYCASGATKETKTTILKISEEFDSNAIEHLNKMLEVFDKLKNYFSETTNQKIDEIAKNISGISTEQKVYLLQIKEQVSTLKDKLWKIKTLSFTSLRDVDKVVNEISSYKIGFTYLEHLDSNYSRDRVSLINSVLDTILVKATALQVAVGKQNTTIKKTIAEYSGEINSFLKYAGYNYSIVLEDDNQGSYKLKLRPSDISATISNANAHLSFGERNALALVLFMYQTLKSNPDIIVLDDPISSFDGNKKYAILYKLFKEKRSFKCKTVILLTHEFGTIIDTIYNMTGTITATAKHLSNKNGTLTEKAINKDKILPFPIIAKENIEGSSNKVNKLIHLRRLLEVENQKGNAWQLLSNIFKDERKIPLFLLPDRTTPKMTPEEIEDASICISEYIGSTFNYEVDYDLIQDKYAMVSLYIASSSNYEKLQLYRIINNSNSSNNVIKKFINETFHVENDYLFQLNPVEFEMVPEYVVNACDKDIKQLYPNSFLMTSNDSDTDNTLLMSIQEKRKRIHLFALPASAGIGNWIDETDYSEVLVYNTNCDYAVYISGDSMEPRILDKSIVLVQIDPDIKNGDIGIFNLNGSIYCKQFEHDSLLSFNEEYNPITINEYDDFYPQGKVVKIISPSEINEHIDFL